MDKIGASGKLDSFGELSPYKPGKRTTSQGFGDELSEQRKAGLAGRIQNLKQSIGDNRTGPGENRPDVMFNHYAGSRNNSGWQA